MRRVMLGAVLFSTLGCAVGAPAQQGECVAPVVDCGGTCIDTSSSPLHCGACDAPCTSEQVCSSGVCAAACSSDRTACEGACVTTAIDPMHCGSCGNACSASEVCVRGSCALVCGMDTSDCDGACVDVGTNPEHCGACGNACRSDERCVGGGCECPVDFVDCDGTCVDLMSDPTSCSRCGNTCASGEACFMGVCAIECGGGMIECSGACVDTLAHMLHCGGCDMPCRRDQTCVGGTCACDTASMDCGGACVDPLTSPLHCGGCDIPCAAGRCLAGTCECPGSMMDCGSGCIDVMVDPLNCGMCGTMCSAGTVCRGSTCLPVRPWSTLLPVSLADSRGYGDLAFLPGGDILAATTRTITRISRIDASRSTFASAVAGTYALGVTHRPSDGMVYISDNAGGIYRITGGTPTRIYGAATRVHSLTVAPPGFGPYGGQLIATLRDGQVLAIDPVGPVAVMIGARVGGNLVDAAFARDGTLYLVDNRNDAVLTMTSSGVFSTYLSSGLRSPDSITIDPSGTRFWVINSGGRDSLVEVTIPGAIARVRATFPVHLGQNVTGILHDGARTLIHRTSAGGLAAISL